MNDRGRPLVDLKEICQQLNAMAGTLARELLPRGSKEGPYWCDASRKNGGLGDSLKVNMNTGRWSWYAADQYGDILDLYALVTNASKTEAIKWARDRLGISGRPRAATARDLEAARKVADETRRQREAAEAEEVEKARAAAKAVWLGSSPDLLSAKPLRGYVEARGIELERLVRYGWGLSCLRYARALWHPYAKEHFPAMVALAVFPDGRTASLHRTYLVQRRGTWDRLRKDIDGHDGKLLYTKIQGGVIPLWRGSRPSKRGTGEVVKNDAYTDPQAGPDLSLIEGIENGLTVVQLDVDRRVGVAVSLANACQIKLPSVYRRLTWIRDNDAPGSKADALLERALDHLADISDELLLAAPPAGVKDFNAGVMSANNETATVPSHDRQEERPEAVP